MFDHVKFGVSDYPASRAFFVKALEPLGILEVTDWPPNGVEIVSRSGASLCLYQTEERPARRTFVIRTRSPHVSPQFHISSGSPERGPDG